MATSTVAATDPQVRLNASGVWQHISDLLHHTAARDAHGVRVKVSDGRVVLTGYVHSLDARDHAECAAWSMPGVTDVQNELFVEMSS